jgi:hypothetical protein
MNRWNWIGLLCCVGATNAAQADATHIVAEATLGHDSNLGHSEYTRDIQDDFFLLAGGNISRSIRLSDNSGLLLRAGLQLREQFDFDDLSQMSLNAGARYRIQPVPGFTAPWFDFVVGAERLQHRNSDIRDGWIRNVGIGVGKLFTDRLKLSGGWNYERRTAEEGRSFDLSNRIWHLDADFRVAPKATLYARGSRIFGDQVSSAPQSTLSGSPLQYSAMTPDPALKEHGISRSAYRFDAVTDTLELGFNYALNGQAALDFSVRYFNADADGGHTYDGFSARAGLLYQF